MLKLVSKITIASGVGQAINFIGIIAVSRYYFPEQFSNFAAFLTISTILSVVISLKLDVLLLSAENKEKINEIARYFVTVAMILGIFSVLISGAVIFTGIHFSSSALSWYKLNNSLNLLLLPTTAISMSFCLFFTQFFIMVSAFNLVNFSRIILPCLNITLCLIFGSFGFEHGLIYSFALSQMICGLMFIWISDLEYSANRLDVKIVLEIFQKTKFYIFSAVLNNITIFLPIIIISKINGVTEAGFYVMAQRLLSSPSFILGNAFSEPLKANLTTLRQKRLGLFVSLRKVFITMFLLSIVPFGLILFTISDILENILGANWKDAGAYCAILLPMFYFRFLMMPCSVAIYAHGKSIIDFIIQVAFIAASILGFVAYHYVSLVLYYSISFSMIYIIVCIVGIKISQIPLRVST